MHIFLLFTCAKKTFWTIVKRNWLGKHWLARCRDLHHTVKSGKQAEECNRSRRHHRTDSSNPHVHWWQENIWDSSIRMYTGARKHLKQSNPHVHWQENTWNCWNSLILKYTGHSLLFLIVPFMWRKAYHRFGTGQRVAHNENRIPPRFAHTVRRNIICETKQILNTFWTNVTLRKGPK